MSDCCAPVIEEYGIGAVTAYVGNPTAHNFSLSRYVGVLIAMSGIPMIYSSGTVDQWPKNLSSLLMYGNMWSFPVPDVPRTDLWVIMGANPEASKGSLLACPDLLGQIDRIRDAGGRTIVVDPRRTGTADRADEWIPIVPGTDAALLMAVVHVLFAEGLVDLGGLAGVVNGLSELAEHCRTFTPEAVQDTCGVPAERIRRLAHELADTERAVLYGRIGLCNQEFGTVASWLVDVVNILTRHFDVPGGLMFPNPVAWSMSSLPRTDWAGGFEAGRWHSRVRGAPEVMGQVPVSCLAEEIDTPGEGQLKGLITVAGNPVISVPEAGRLDAALPMLECMISVDNWINETTRHADIILPGLSPLEQPHYDDLLWSLAVRSAAKWNDAVFPPEAGRPAEWEILIRLAAICGGTKADEVDVAAIDDGFFSAIVATTGLDPATVLAHYDQGGPERMTDFMVRTGPWGDRFGENPEGLTLERIKEHAHGLDLGPMVPRLDEVLQTPSGRLELAPAYITADLERLRTRLGRPREPLGAGEPAPRPVQELLDAQRERPGERQGPLHIAHPSRGCLCLRGRRWTAGAGHIRVGHDRGPGGGKRRDDARGRLPSARLGPRQARHPHVGGSGPPRGEQQPPGAGPPGGRDIGQRRRQRDSCRCGTCLTTCASGADCSRRGATNQSRDCAGRERDDRQC